MSNTIPVFYRPEQTVPVDVTGVRSPRKPAFVVESWRARGLPLELRSYEPVTEQDLCLVHDPAYVRGVLSLQHRDGFGLRNEKLARSFLYTSGSFLAAARHAFQQRTVAVSPTSGFHHAGYGHGGGFCTFNGLALSAAKLVEDGARKVGILDMDAHYGDGTEDILGHLPRLAPHVLHYTYGADRISNGRELAAVIDTSLQEWKDEGVEIILYQAGADPHEHDDVGGCSLTTEAMRLRDRTVFQACARLGLPVAWNLAGGYQVAPGEDDDRDYGRAIRPVLELHDNTFIECAAAFLRQEAR